MIPISTRSTCTLRLLAIPVALAALTLAPRALADALPPTACDNGATVGQSCTTAGNGTEDGTCESETCAGAGHPLPDGGFTAGSSYPCLLCELPDAGPPAPDAGPSTPDAGPIPPEDAGPEHPTADAGPESSDAGASATHLAGSSSCSVGALGAGAGGTTLFGLGGIGLVFSSLFRGRRRREG